MDDVRAVILAGGKGTRLFPYTAVLPKPLMPVGDMPILEVVVRQLGRAGIRRITMSVGYLGSLLQAYFGDGERWDVRIDYSREETPLGTAGPLSLVEGLTRTFLVMNGDVLTTLDFRSMLQFHREKDGAATVALARKRVTIDLGVVEADGDGGVVGYIEKPVLEHQVSMGIYVMEPMVLRYVPPGRRLDLPDLMATLIAAGHGVCGYRFNGHWLDIGRPDDCARAAELFERERAVFLPGGA